MTFKQFCHNQKWNIQFQESELGDFMAFLWRIESCPWVEEDLKESAKQIWDSLLPVANRESEKSL